MELDLVVKDDCIKVETILPPGHEGALRNVRGQLVGPQFLELSLLQPLSRVLKCGRPFDKLSVSGVFVGKSLR